MTMMMMVSHALRVRDRRSSQSRTSSIRRLGGAGTRLAQGRVDRCESRDTHYGGLKKFSRLPGRRGRAKGRVKRSKAKQSNHSQLHRFKGAGGGPGHLEKQASSNEAREKASGSGDRRRLTTMTRQREQLKSSREGQAGDRDGDDDDETYTTHIPLMISVKKKSLEALSRAEGPLE